MKKLAFALALLLIVSTAQLSYASYRNRQYKTDYNSLFGSDKYLIEDIGDGNINFYVGAPKNTDEEYVLSDVLKDYMKKQGFEYLPEELSGLTYYFADSNGERAECVAENFRNYTVWEIHFPKTTK